MAKMKKQKPQSNSNTKFLRSMELEDQMHDDHGPVIIGRRDKKPNIPEEKDKNKK